MQEALHEPKDGRRVNSVYDCLSHPRRRYALHRLIEAGEPLALADLAADVAASETDLKAGEVPTDTVENVHVSLHHVHVPKLAAASLVRYDTDRKVVELLDLPQTFREEPVALLAK